MSEVDTTSDLRPEDRHLLDLISDVMVDPNLHTDLRMRLQAEIGELLRSTHRQSRGPTEHRAHERRLEAYGDHLPDLMEAVLSDPNLHTDVRMRLYREIPELVQAAHDRAVQS